MKIIIIGGGILGTAHALEAISRGHHVIQLEREQQARENAPDGDGEHGVALDGHAGELVVVSV